MPKASTSAQTRYAITFLLVTTVVLAFLNIYCAGVNQELFRQNKKTALTERAVLIATEISVAAEDPGRNNGISGVLSRMDMQLERLIITDEQGAVIYDSAPVGSETALPTEIAAASRGNQFTWNYRDGVMTSAVAVAIRHESTYMGCVYLSEIDSSDGQLLKNLQTSILTITLVLEAVLILFSVCYITRYSRRIKKIMTSMRTIQNGDFSHKIQMGGHDELSFLAAEFNFLTDRLEISENKRRQFVSDASHELKTPLASIKLLSDSILQYDMDMATVREFAGDIGNEADRLTRMTNKLLALTKSEADTAPSDVEIIYMAPTVERVARMLDGIAARNKITVSLDLRQDSTVLLQEDDLYQITFNLAENGIKYNRPGGSLSISLHRQEDMAVLRISDTGVGIPPEALSHVFERFYRVDKARSRQSGGSGLGLSIVRSMVERNNGEIHLQSTVGKGTVFTVSFPCFDISQEQINTISSEEEQ